jgi:hypothetical protein
LALEVPLAAASIRGSVMLSMVEQVGLTAAMLLAAAGSVICLLFLVTAAILELRETRSLARADDQATARAGFWRGSGPSRPLPRRRRQPKPATDFLFISIMLGCFVAVAAYVALVAHP